MNATGWTSLRSVKDARFLTAAERAQLMPTEAELLAIDRNYAIAKDSGALFRDADRRALQQQLNEVRS